MAELLEDGKYEQTVYGSLKVGHILCHEEGGKKSYIKIRALQKVKTGKHGAAKVMIQGKDIATGKSFMHTSPGSVTCSTIEMSKKPFILEDIIGQDNTFYMRPNDNSNEGSVCYPTHKINREHVLEVKAQFEANDKGELSLMVVTAPEYISFENVRPHKQQ